MKLTQLQYFLDVAEGYTLSQTARRSGVSQPCISSAIRSLEAEFGFPLFENEKNRLSLTREGKVMAAYARELIAEFQKAESFLSKKSLEAAI